MPLKTAYGKLVFYEIKVKSFIKLTAMVAIDFEAVIDKGHNKSFHTFKKIGIITAAITGPGNGTIKPQRITKEHN